MSKTYKITLKNCSFYAFHGVFEFEKQNGQRFFVDAELTIKQPSSLLDDNLDDVVDYGAVFSHIQSCVTGQSFDLIETLAAYIGEQICQNFPNVLNAIISIRKPNAPIEGDFDYVEVSVETSNV